MIENKLEDSKTDLDPLVNVDTKKMPGKNRLKEKQKITRASTEEFGHLYNGRGPKMIRRILDYEAISEKTGESDFGASHDFLGSEALSKKN